jgi:hypothetical protein
MIEKLEQQKEVLSSEFDDVMKKILSAPPQGNKKKGKVTSINAQYQGGNNHDA